MSALRKFPLDDPRVQLGSNNTVRILADPMRSQTYLEDHEVEELERAIKAGTRSVNEIAWRLGVASRTVSRHAQRLRQGREHRALREKADS